MDATSSPNPRPTHGLRLLGVAAVLLVLVGLWFLRPRPQPQAAAWPTVARSNLVMRTGGWYLLESTNPFTGFMEDPYPDGQLLSRTAISNGLLNGLCETWYTNGQVQMREHFTNGVSNGLRQKWHPNGQLETEANIVAGVIEGTFRRWHDNGQLAEEIQMKGGQPDGTAVAYFPSGFVKAETQVRAGKIIDRQIWQDGEHKPAFAAAEPRQ